MEQFLYKKRLRNKRGPLTDFFDLPTEKQENFIKIKAFLIEYFGKELDVYVWGSYKHGYWDELSDYDVITYEMGNAREIDSLIFKKLNLKVNVNCITKKFGIVLIP